MEQILEKLLQSDSKVIQKGTKELKDAFKTTEAIPALCDVLVVSTNPHIRQTAAVILRRKLGKKKLWNKLNADMQKRIKQGMMQALVNEPEKMVKNSIAQFIGIIGKHEFPSNNWPEILQFIHTLTSSDNLLDKELGMYTLSIMTDISKSSYIVHAELFANLFSNVLTGLPELNSNVAYYTVVTMKNLVAVIGGHQQMINLYHSLLPRILEILNEFAQHEEKRACDLFEILEELIEYAVAVVLPHISTIIQMCLRISCTKDIDTSVQIKAVSIVGWLIRAKSKVIQKHKLVEPIIDVLIQLMAQQPDDDVNEEYFLGDPDQFTTTTIATQTLDLIALNIPPEKVVPYLLTRVEPALQGNDIYAQKAAYLALALLAEGCADHIRAKYLDAFLKCIYNGIRNPNVVVRNAAFFALGQFAEHLQPEISQYAAELLPVFFEFIAHVYVEMQENKNEPNGLDRMFYALQTFCVNLDDALLPFLPTLMERLLYALDPASPLESLQIKRVSISTIDSVASAVKEHMLPYFEQIVKLLLIYINADPDSPIYELQSYAIECLATIADNIEPEKFKPIALQTLEIALRILNKTDDPDVKKSIFALFAALAGVMKEDISPVLPNIIENMITSVQSTDGIVTIFDDDDEEKDCIDLYESSEEEGEVDIEEESSSSDSTQARYSVENSYNEEKEQACLSLSEICKYIGPLFLPYLEKSFEEIFKLINYPQEDIRHAAIQALEQFCLTLSELQTSDGKQALYKALQIFVPKCAELIRCDDEQSIVIQATNAFSSLLDGIKGDVLVGEGHREAIMNCVIDLLTQKTACQDTDIGGGDSAEDEAESEQTELLLECAGDVIPKFGNALTPDDFVFYFNNILQLLSIRTKKKNSISQRSFAYGTLAECMKPLGAHISKYVDPLLHLWHVGAKDKNEEVRNNAVFGLGEMILHGKDSMLPHYNDILNLLSNMFSKESHAGTMDNICGAVAKMILVNPNAVPLEAVFPALLQHLPLKVDFEENKAVLNCIFGLYQQGNQIVKQNLITIIKIAATICHKKQTNSEEVLKVLKEFLQTVNKDFPQEFVTTVSSLGPEVTESLSKLFNSN